MAIWEDDRVTAGMARQLAARDAALGDGATHLGWKVGLSTPMLMERLGTDGAMLGFLTDRNLLDSGASVAVGDWATPVAEPEIAVRLRVDVPAGSDRDAVADAIDAIAPAIELADIDTPLEELEELLAGNVFQRHVILGDWDTGRAGADLTGVLLDVDGAESIVAQADPTAMVGDVLDVIAALADALDAFGPGLRAGDVVITGTMVPPIALEPGTGLRVRLAGVGEVAVDLV